MTASSVHSQYFEAERARLNKKNEGSYYGAWVPKRFTLGEWIQIDLGKNVKVTRIATQGPLHQEPGKTRVLPWSKPG